MKTFNNKIIRSFKPCYDPIKYFKDDEELTVLSILNRKDISFEDRLWCILRNEFVSEKLMRLFAVWSARQVQHLMSDQRSLNALDISEKFANGSATSDELYAAGAAARDAAWAAAWDAARAAAWDAARAAARDAAGAAARDAARAAQENKLREMILAGIETGDTK